MRVMRVLKRASSLRSEWREQQGSNRGANIEYIPHPPNFFFLLTGQPPRLLAYTFKDACKWAASYGATFSKGVLLIGPTTITGIYIYIYIYDGFFFVRKNHFFFVLFTG